MGGVGVGVGGCCFDCSGLAGAEAAPWAWGWRARRAEIPLAPIWLLRRLAQGWVSSSAPIHDRIELHSLQKRGREGERERGREG